jgi:3-oxoacyl-[acyl-carrier protein] reductase
MPTDYLSLEGQTAIVTGAGRGIGRAIARRLSDAGARVAVVDIDPESAVGAAQELREGSFGVQADVSDTRDVETAFGEVLGRWDALDILVNNAGVIGLDLPVKDIPDTEWDRVINTNLRSVFLCSRAAVRHMVGRGKGAIVSVASIAGKEGNPNMAPYSVSKAGIICLTKALAREVVSHGIRVNCVAPALIETTLTEGMDRQQIDFMTSRIPMGRFGRPEEVAAAVHFLASDESSFTTGQCYDVSGGRATY